ncbi:hypothetical protein HAX54_051416, partial [Datura stramonium]|nr:hypothetical protein [Datura stramonium]
MVMVLMNLVIFRGENRQQDHCGERAFAVARPLQQTTRDKKLFTSGGVEERQSSRGVAACSSSVIQ